MFLISLRMRISPFTVRIMFIQEPIWKADLLLDKELNQVVKSVTFFTIKKLGLESLLQLPQPKL